MEETPLPEGVSYEDYTQEERGMSPRAAIQERGITDQAKLVLLAITLTYGMGGAPADPNYYREMLNMSPMVIKDHLETLAREDLIRPFPGDPSRLQTGWWNREL